jgi:hypothetical protein
VSKLVCGQLVTFDFPRAFYAARCTARHGVRSQSRVRRLGHRVITSREKERGSPLPWLTVALRADLPADLAAKLKPVNLAGPKR